jgi:hypothetical protein
MKKFLSFVLFLVPFFYANAQFNVYSNNFNADGVEGWSLIDNDGSGMTWNLKNNDNNEIIGSGTPFMVLSSATSGEATLDNWAILPAQDMSFYTDTKISITYLKGIFEGEKNDSLTVYAATTANIEDLLATEPIGTFRLEGDSSLDPAEEATVTIDIPAEYNVANMYFALRHKKMDDVAPANWAVELTEVVITAEDVAGFTTITGKTWLTTVKQNPVKDNLLLQLGSRLQEEATTIKIYTTNGILVSETKYNKTGATVNNLSSGLYFATLTDGTITEKVKFIKQ